MIKKKGAVPKSSFLKKLFLSILAMIITITIILSTFLMGSYFRSASSLIDKFFNDLLLQSNYSITYTNELAQSLASSLSYNREVVTFLNLKRQDGLQAVVTTKAVDALTMPLPYVDGVYLYNKGLDLVLSTKTGTQSALDDFYDKEVANYLKNEMKQFGTDPSPIVHEVSYSRQRAFIYSYLIPDYNFEGDISSVIVVNIKVDVLTKSLMAINSNNVNTQFVVTDQTGRLLCDSPFSSPDETAAMNELIAGYLRSGNTGGNERVSIGDTRYLLTYNNNNSNGWYLFGMVPYSIIFQDLIVSTLWIVGFLFLLLTFGTFISMLLAKRLNRPVAIIEQIAKGGELGERAKAALGTKEFQYVASVFSEMRTENEQFTKYKNETVNFVRQEFLENLVCGTAVYATDRATARLEELGCGYMLNDQLCMCLLSIDDYPAFSVSNNQRERWAIRFAVINIASELFSEYFMCDTIQRGPRKFIAVINCSDQSDYNRFTAVLEKVLTDINTQVSRHLHFTLTMAYSNFFKDLSRMPGVYENLEELLQLKVHHGHGKILNPYMAEEAELDDFQVSSASENLLISSVVSADSGQALEKFQKIETDLFLYSYSEIMSYLVHLAYRIYSSAKEGNSLTKPEMASAFQNILSALSQCEIQQDFHSEFTNYIEKVCEILISGKNSLINQNTNSLVQKILKIVETKYPQKELCLNFIADELGLSVNYIGRIFREAQNKSVAKHILDTRLEHAASLLRESNEPFIKIMDEVGLEPDQKNYIYTCFKKYFGVTVKNYRMQFNTEAVED